MMTKPYETFQVLHHFSHEQHTRPSIQNHPFVEHVVLQHGDVKWATSISVYHGLV
jgi:hypothetical protein